MRKIIIISIILMTFIYCKNDKNKTFKNQFGVVDDLLDVSSQYFFLDLSKDTVIEGDKGTKINIKAGCFGIDSGIVNLELKEYYNISDMLTKGLLTVTENNILESDGMIYLSVKKSDGRILKLKNNMCSIEMPSTNLTSEIELFYKSDSTSIWILSTSEIDTSNYTNDSTVFFAYDKRYNIFNISNLGWINADAFLEFENKIDLIVDVPNNQKGALYSLAFYNYNSILPGEPNKKGQLVFKGLPSGEKVTLIGLGEQNGKTYSSILDLTTDSKNAKIEPLKEISKDDLQAKLEMKFGADLAQRPEPSF